MVKFDIKLLTWLALEKNIERLEQDINAVEAYDNGRVTEVYFLCYDDKIITDKSLREKLKSAKQKVSKFCTKQNVEIHEIPVEVEPSSLKKSEIAFPTIKRALLPYLNDMGEFYINCSEKESELSAFWDYCKEEDLFCGLAFFVGKNENKQANFAQIDLSAMVAKVDSYIEQKKDTIELIQEFVKKGGDCVYFVCEDQRKYLDIQSKVPILRDYYVNGVYSLKNYEYLPQLKCCNNISLYVLTSTKPESVHFLYITKENFLLLRYLHSSLQNWLNFNGECPSILKNYINDVPYSMIDMDHIDAHYNCQKALGFRLSIKKKKTKKLKDFATCIAWQGGSQDFILCCGKNKIIGRDNIQDTSHLDKISEVDKQCMACKVCKNDIIANPSLGKNIRFYLIQESLDHLFISDDLICIRLTANEISPEYLCLYLNNQIQSKSLNSRYLSYMEGPLLLKDIECIPVAVPNKEDVKDNAYYKTAYSKYLESNRENNADELSKVHSYEYSKTAFDDCVIGDNIFTQKEIRHFSNTQKNLKEEIQNYVNQGNFKQAVIQVMILVEKIAMVWCSRVAGKDYNQVPYKGKQMMNAADAYEFLKEKKLISSALYPKVTKFRDIRNVRLHRNPELKVGEEDYYNASQMLNELCRAYGDWDETNVIRMSKQTIDVEPFENEK